MIFLLPVLLVAAALAPLRIRLFEATFSTLLFAPVLGFLVGHFAPLTGTTYTIIILAEVVVWYLVAFSSRASRATQITLHEILPLAVFAVVSLLCLSLVMLWPDFISIGERIRDFSLVATTIRSPLVPEEPWMSGSPLNYYVYWYRFGQMLSVLLNLEV